LICLYTEFRYFQYLENVYFYQKQYLSKFIIKKWVKWNSVLYKSKWIMIAICSSETRKNQRISLEELREGNLPSQRLFELTHLKELLQNANKDIMFVLHKFFSYLASSLTFSYQFTLKHFFSASREVKWSLRHGCYFTSQLAITIEMKRKKALYIFTGWSRFWSFPEWNVTFPESSWLLWKVKFLY